MKDNTIQAKRLSEFFKNLGKKGPNVSKKGKKNILSKPGRALDNTADIVTAAATRNPKNKLSNLPEVINVYHTGKGLHFNKFVWFMLYKWNRTQQSYIHLHLQWAPTNNYNND